MLYDPSITVRLQPEQKEYLDQKRNEGISSSYIIRLALQEWMSQNEVGVRRKDTENIPEEHEPE